MHRCPGLGHQRLGEESQSTLLPKAIDSYLEEGKR